MPSKKYTLLSGLLLLFGSCLLAQENNSSYDLHDSSLIPAKRLPQHNEFLNNAYPFPAKPRNEIEIGLKGGLSTVSGDIRAWLPTGGIGLHVRKALGYVFSLRLEYDWLRGKGLNWSPSYSGYSANPQISQYYSYATNTPVFYNYKPTIHDLSLQGVFTLNNIRFHKAKTGINFYALLGGGVATYATYMNMLDASGKPY